MPSRIAKGFSLCTAIVGVLCLLTGLGIAICAWVLNGRLPTGFHYQQKDQQSGTITIGSYWWGGMIYVLPGIIGIIAGCTRSVAAMIFYLFFNFICCICSLVVVVLCGIVLLFWVLVDEALQSGSCHSPISMTACACSSDKGDFQLYGASCDVFMHVQVIVVAMVSFAAMSAILSFIASYISCCALCNKENIDTGHVIIAGGAGVYQPPPVVVGHTTEYQPFNQQNPHQPGQGYPPPPYVQQQPPPYNPNFPPQETNGQYQSPHQVPHHYPYQMADGSKDNLVHNGHYR